MPQRHAFIRSRGQKRNHVTIHTLSIPKSLQNSFPYMLRAWQSVRWGQSPALRVEDAPSVDSILGRPVSGRSPDSAASIGDLCSQRPFLRHRCRQKPHILLLVFRFADGDSELVVGRICIADGFRGSDSSRPLAVDVDAVDRGEGDAWSGEARKGEQLLDQSLQNNGGSRHELERVCSWGLIITGSDVAVVFDTRLAGALQADDHAMTAGEGLLADLHCAGHLQCDAQSSEESLVGIYTHNAT